MGEGEDGEVGRGMGRMGRWGGGGGGGVWDSLHEGWTVVVSTVPGRVMSSRRPYHCWPS